MTGCHLNLGIALPPSSLALRKWFSSSRSRRSSRRPRNGRFASSSKNVRLPGFRKGKVPRKIFEQTYGSEAVTSQRHGRSRPRGLCQGRPRARPRAGQIAEARGARGDRRPSHSREGDGRGAARDRLARLQGRQGLAPSGRCQRRGRRTQPRGARAGARDARSGRAGRPARRRRHDRLRGARRRRALRGRHAPPARSPSSTRGASFRASRPGSSG